MEKVTDKIYRGKRPDIVILQECKQIGIKTVLTLDDDIIFTIRERGWCREVGLYFFEYPLSSFHSPTYNELLFTGLLLKTLPTPLFVHCRHGCDRTGYVIATYRMLECGWSFKEAWRECVEYGHKWYLLPWWLPSLLRVKNLIDKKR